ncbi:MAG: hypothetical protein WC209_13830 [Ignavibacteriaceae bacterium]|jgi:hypothetical protein
MAYLGSFSQSLLFFSLFLFLFSKTEVGKEKRVLVIYIALASLSDVTATTTLYYCIKNIWLAHIYFPIEFLFFFLILLQWVIRYRKYWILTGVIIGVYIVVDYFFLTDLSMYSALALSIQSSFFFLFSASILIEITTRNFIPFYKDERFYIAAGVFIYSGLTSLMYLFYNAFNVLFPFYVVSLSAICLNLFFTYSMVLYYRQRKMLAEVLK